jgi:hypothetical protein
MSCGSLPADTLPEASPADPSSSDFFYVNEESLGSNSEHRKVFFSPLSKAICEVDNASLVLREKNVELEIECDDLLVVFNDLIRQYFRRSQFLTQLHDSDSSSAEYALAMEPSDTITVVQPLGSQHVEHDFRYPKEEFLAERGVETDVAIFVSDIRIEVKDEGIPKLEATETYKMTRGLNPKMVKVPKMRTRHSELRKTTPTIRTMVKYIVWDYEYDAALGYGQFAIQGGLLTAPGSYNEDADRIWMHIASSALKTIYSETRSIKELKSPCATATANDFTPEQMEKSVETLRDLLATAFPSWLDAFSNITIEYAGSGPWACHGEASIDPPADGDPKPAARIKLYESYCAMNPTAALAHLVMHYEPMNRQGFLEGGASRARAESDANTFGSRWQMRMDPKMRMDLR